MVNKATIIKPFKVSKATRRGIKKDAAKAGLTIGRYVELLTRFRKEARKNKVKINRKKQKNNTRLLNYK
ncbi:hypothetical protein [Paludibacterium sp.]|uniref:hypothetical protein n=1 Tax=Paludibacterium sp. TaxID=1917523 RepID=UPI0025E353B8|nr:hypothetical protein [Paludibacterium sp.]MBV8649610.1 hypothetical protein [Paludibacterium sp.]